MEKIREYLEIVSPFIFKPEKQSLTISISKRFFLFKVMNNIINIIEEDPHLNFIALLKSYKILGRILTGTLHEFYRDRNKLYFKKFFVDRDLYTHVKADLEYFYPKYKEVLLTITKRGIIIYDNYKKNSFNVLLMTIHSGRWVPEKIKNKLEISEKKRFSEEDIDTHKIYSNLVLEKGGIWIDTKQSRFVVDFNRSLGDAIYADKSEEWLDVVWKEPLNKAEKEEIHAGYRDFYFTLSRLLESYNFNIIFDGHSMRDESTRPNISFGTRYIPNFYMPIVESMKRKMISLGYSPVRFNCPYYGGFILKWMSNLYPSVFIFSMEVNKKLYMSERYNKSIRKKVNRLAKDLTTIFNIEITKESEEHEI